MKRLSRLQGWPVKQCGKRFSKVIRILVLILCTVDIYIKIMAKDT